MSLCSEHKEPVPHCYRCRLELDLTLADDRIRTCSECNFVYYAHCDTCPKCQTENI